jgi:hypothetical protein
MQDHDPDPELITDPDLKLVDKSDPVCMVFNKYFHGEVLES